MIEIKLKTLKSNQHNEILGKSKTKIMKIMKTKNKNINIQTKSCKTYENHENLNNINQTHYKIIK